MLLGLSDACHWCITKWSRLYLCILQLLHSTPCIPFCSQENKQHFFPNQAFVLLCCKFELIPTSFSSTSCPGFIQVMPHSLLSTSRAYIILAVAMWLTAGMLLCTKQSEKVGHINLQNVVCWKPVEIYIQHIVWICSEHPLPVLCFRMMWWVGMFF